MGEAKQIAQQEAQRASYQVEKAVQEKQQKIVQAEGETAAARMLGEATSQNPGYLKLRKLAAAQKISSTVAASQNRVYLNAGSLLLNINDSEFDARLLPRRNRPCSRIKTRKPVNEGIKTAWCCVSLAKPDLNWLTLAAAATGNSVGIHFIRISPFSCV